MNNACGLYIHVPFCRHKCIYCDFYSTTRLADIPRYLDALMREWESTCLNPPSGGFAVSSLYWGGGTPSLLTPRQVQRLLDEIHPYLSVAAAAEITLEANPGALDDAHLAAYRNAGINRLSLGVQSFIDDELEFLTRIHSAADAGRSFAAARRAGYDNLSLDLIFALPRQTVAAWRRSLLHAIELTPEHISMYGLTFEKGTPLHESLNRGAWGPCDEEVQREMYLLGKEMLEAAGYRHYEISSFARPGREARHNQHYWEGSPYIGLGPAAHSFAEGRRWWNVRDVRAYCRALENGGKATAGEETLTRDQRRAEALLLGLRRREGISLSGWRNTYSESPLSLFSEALEKLGGCDRGTPPFQNSSAGRLITHFDDQLALTSQGLLLHDYICRKLYENLE